MLNLPSHPILRLQRTIGNQAVRRMLQTNSEELEEGLASTASPLSERDISRSAILPIAAAAIQTKLTINEPGDIYEQEADRVSEQVMRAPEPQVQRACACGGGCPLCQTQQSGYGQERLQTKRVQSSDTGQITAPPVVHEVLRSPGRPLDSATRAFMEPRFGYDFSRVRVHTGADAGRSARDVNAHAYTVGHNMVFGAGRFAPETFEGRRLIAHELTHIVQQTGGVSHPGSNEAQGQTASGPSAVGEVRTIARPASLSAGAGVLQRDGRRTVTKTLHPEETGIFYGSFKLPGGAGFLSYTAELRNIPPILLDPTNRPKLDIECEFGVRAVLQEQLKSGPLPSGIPALHISVDAGYSKALNEGHVERLVRRAARAELKRAITQAQEENAPPPSATETSSFSESTPVLGELASEAAATFLPAAEGAGEILAVLTGDDTPTYEDLPEAAERLGVDVAPAPPPASTATSNCLDLLDTDPQAYVECEKQQRLNYAENIQKGAMSVTEPIATGLEAVNPLDPTNLAVGGFAGTVLKIRKVIKTTKATKAVTKVAKIIPQGFTEITFKKFAKAARRLRKEAKLPDKGELVIHGSRVKGTAKATSDIDVALRVDEETFFDLAEKALSRTQPDTRLRKTMLKRINKNGQLSSFDLGTEFTKLRRELLDSESPIETVQFSVLKVGGKLDTGPFLPLE